MDPRTTLIAAKLSGKIPVVLGIGRLGYFDRFEPFGQAKFEAMVYQNPDGIWVAKVEKVAVPYEHPSPRLITHIGMFMCGRWLIAELSNFLNMTPNDVATFHIFEYPLPETL